MLDRWRAGFRWRMRERRVRIPSLALVLLGVGFGALLMRPFLPPRAPHLPTRAVVSHRADPQAVPLVPTPRGAPGHAPGAHGRPPAPQQVDQRLRSGREDVTLLHRASMLLVLAVSGWLVVAARRRRTWRMPWTPAADQAAWTRPAVPAPQPPATGDTQPL